jgi:uncharacterized protein YcbK (DUF882 family)
MSIDAIFAGFNAAEIEPQSARGLVAPGWYTVVIDKTTSKINNAGTGSYLELEFQIVEGENKGRRVWDRLNLDNPNQTAVDIAKASLSAICHAVNVLTPQSPEELKDILLEALVAVQPAKGQYGESNIIKGYRPAQAQKPAKAKPKAPKLTEPEDDDLPF